MAESVTRELDASDGDIRYTGTLRLYFLLYMNDREFQTREGDESTKNQMLHDGSEVDTSEHVYKLTRIWRTRYLGVLG